MNKTSMTREQMIARFYELEDEIESFAQPQRTEKESGHRYLPTDHQQRLNDRQRMAFAIARSMPRPGKDAAKTDGQPILVPSGITVVLDPARS